MCSLCTQCVQFHLDGVNKRASDSVEIESGLKSRRKKGMMPKRKERRTNTEYYQHYLYNNTICRWVANEVQVLPLRFQFALGSGKKQRKGKKGAKMTTYLIAALLESSQVGGWLESGAGRVHGNAYG